MAFARKLATLCARRDWKKADLTRAVKGVSPSTVGNWLSGLTRPDMKTALRVARALGVSLDYLADDTQEQEPDADRLSTEEMVAVKCYRRLVERVGPADAILMFVDFVATVKQTADGIPRPRTTVDVSTPATVAAEPRRGESAGSTSVTKSNSDVQVTSASAKKGRSKGAQGA